MNLLRPSGAGALREALLKWVRQHAHGHAGARLDATTPIIEQRVITSLQIPDLILFLEELLGRRIEAADLKPGVFRSVATLCEHFHASDPGASR